MSGAILRLLLLAGVVLAGGEFGARLDDRLFAGVPFAASPSSDDLITNDAYGRHGRPYAHFQKWHLDNLGFRGPDVAFTPTPGVPRVLILGASETFGLYESPDHEFAALLRAAHPELEIVNASVVGMGLTAMSLYWERQLRDLRPQLVLLYPTALFYLGDAPRNAAAVPAAAAPELRSRFLGRLRVGLHKPDFVQIRIDQRAVQAQLARRPTETLFTDLPTERLDAYQRDLAHLVELIQARGARVMLLTHAVRYRGDESGLDDSFAVWEARVFFPRATGHIMVAFNRATNERLREVAREYHLAVIDIDAGVTGCDACFGDLVHFTDRGAARAADAVEASAALTSVAPR